MRNNEEAKKRYQMCLIDIQDHIAENGMIYLDSIGAEYSQPTFHNYGQIFHYSELEEAAASLINNDFSKLTEVVYFDPEGHVLVHPEIALRYLEELRKYGGWKYKKVGS